MKENMDMTSKILLWILTLSMLVVILASTYKFLILKNYNFLVEASCDPTEEICFFRDCETEECPPNNLSYYKTYVIRASDFSRCSTDGCTNECKLGEISCEEIPCGESEEDICSEESDAEIEETISTTTNVSEE